MNDNQTQNLPEPKNEIVVYQPDDTQGFLFALTAKLYGCHRSR